MGDARFAKGQADETNAKQSKQLLDDLWASKNEHIRGET